MANILQVSNVVTRLRIRQEPSTSSAIIGYFSPGTTNIQSTKEENGWYFIPDKNGWCKSDYMTIIGTTEDGSTNNIDNSVTAEQQVAEEMTLEQVFYLMEQFAVNDDTTSKISDEMVANSMNGIWGLPYQFMSSVDLRIGNNDDIGIGRSYADRIMTRMPLMLLAPGKVKFMRSDAEKFVKDVTEKANKLIELVGGDKDASLGTKYYSFEDDWATYYKAVNVMCTTGAEFLGLSDIPVKIGNASGKLSTIQWDKAQESDYKNYMQGGDSNAYVAFFVESSGNVSEELSNGTTESTLSSTVNGFSSSARELQFLVGSITGREFLDEEAESNVMNAINEIQNKYFNGGQIFTDIAAGFATVAMGGKLIFPEIWNDSEYSKSFDFTVKLRCPDGDDLSWYLNIYVPLVHLICLTAPHQSDNVNGIKSPFLVRGYFKGLFNCDMGIITSLSISKGNDAGWTKSGLPLEVDVSVQLKDLYQSLSIITTESPYGFISNTALSTYVANTCGVAINKTGIDQQWEMYKILTANKLKHIPHNIVNQFEQYIENLKMSLNPFNQ